MMQSKKYCCKGFETSATEYQTPVGGGLYPFQEIPQAQFEMGENGLWAINGCCGGGCCVVEQMKFCPYCGSKLENLNDQQLV